MDNENIIANSPMDQLSTNLMKMLETQQQPINALGLARMLGLVTAKDVNPTLYKLEKLNKVIKHNVIPPTWSINKNKIEPNKIILSRIPNELRDKIINFLKNQDYPVEAKYIVDKFTDNTFTISQLNSILYSLLSEGSILKISTTPPLWYISKSYDKDILILEITESLESASVEHLLAVRHFSKEKSHIEK